MDKSGLSSQSLVASFHKIVFMLIENSLFSSHANDLEVTINFIDFWIEVADNGEFSCYKLVGALN